MFQKTRRFLIAALTAIASVSFANAQETATEDSAPPPDAVSAEDLIAVAAGPVDYFDKDSFSIRTVVCPFKGAVDYKPDEISCGLLEVPENREKARPRKIELHFAKIHAKKPDDWDAEEKGEWVKRHDPVIYLTGGPGVKAQGYVARLKDHGVRETRDLYILEQRGIGWSGDFCPLYNRFDPAASNTPDWAQYQRATLDAMETCFAAARAAKVDLSGYSSIENARDVKALRRALGLEQWNVWGISYGSILGQAYMKADPEGVRASVIDAIVPLQQDITFHNIARYYDRVLTILTDACEADGACARQFPDVKERLEKAIQKVSMAPIEVDAVDKELFPSGKGYFFQDVIGGAPFVLFYEQSNYPSMPAFIDAFVRLAEEENHEPFRVLTAGGAGQAFDMSPGMYNAVACNDNWFAAMKKALEEDARDYPALAMIFGDPALIDEQARMCRRYGMEPRPAADYSALETDIRTLIVEGQMDPITPPPLAKAILPGFSNGTYVEFAYAGHGPTRSVDCAGDFLTAFYDDPEGALDTSCPDGMEAPDFIAPLFETGAFATFAVMMAEDRKNALKPGLWLGLPALILIGGLVIYTIAPIARIVNGAPGTATGGARLVAWVTALLGAASVGGLGYAAYASYEANEFLLMVGVMDWGRWFALAGLAAGLTGLVALWLTVMARVRTSMPIGVLTGLVLIGGAGLGLASWLAVWGFLPF